MATEVAKLLQGTVIGVTKIKLDKFTRKFRWMKVAVTGSLPYMTRIDYRVQVTSGTHISFDATKPFAAKDVIFCNTKTINVLGEETVEFTFGLSLDDILFGDNHIEARPSTEGMKIRTALGVFPVKSTRIWIQEDVWEKFLPDFDLSFQHNKVKRMMTRADLDAKVLIVAGKYRVFYNWDGTVYIRPTDDITIARVGDTLASMKRLIAESETSKRWAEIRRRIREILKMKSTITVPELRELTKAYGVKVEGSEEDYLRGLTWHKDYEEQYFDYLKERAGTNTIYFSRRGYFFEIGGVTSWEVPKVGSATYFFKGRPSEVISKLGDLGKEEIWEAKKLVPEKVDFYIGRVIHNNEEQWVEDVEEILKKSVVAGVSTFSPTGDDSVEDSDLDAGRGCPKCGSTSITRGEPEKNDDGDVTYWLGTCSNSHTFKIWND